MFVEHRLRDLLRIGPMCLTGLGEIPFEAAFGASEMICNTDSVSQKLKSQEQFLFRNLNSEKAIKLIRVKAHRIPKHFWPTFSCFESFHRKWRLRLPNPL